MICSGSELKINKTRVQETLQRKDVVIFDFDGVIKESVEVKRTAYLKLGKLVGADDGVDLDLLLDSNSGSSRFELVPLLCSYATLENAKSQSEMLAIFSSLVKEEVIQSPYCYQWREFMGQLKEHGCQSYIASATPHQEMVDICNRLGIYDLFVEILGSPEKKPVLLKKILRDSGSTIAKSLFIGDSISDFNASQVVGIEFWHRNKTVEDPGFEAPWFKDFSFS